ncbi:hypothetical protein V496_03449 [Pseudogymnoascus sp. VKM F-4515 (FW-2607)]|nr:hypothetical protein V496_03449 [Pseudogymnoascus sp. VKM F-4515 (FW-2607)]
MVQVAPMLLHPASETGLSRLFPVLYGMEVHPNTVHTYAICTTIMGHVRAQNGPWAIGPSTGSIRGNTKKKKSGAATTGFVSAVCRLIDGGSQRQESRYSPGTLYSGHQSTA